MPRLLNPNPTIFDLKRINEELEKEIIERKQTERELLRAKDEAEKASRAKSEFLSQMSHELRTPMNAILGFSQLLETHPEEPLTPLQSMNVREILKAGNHLLNLINELLDLSHIESGKLTLSIEPVSVDSVVGDTLALIIPLARQWEVTVINKIKPQGNCYAMADITRLKQVLLNLMSNAIKYNKPKGMVLLECEAVSEERLRISVHDTGFGIPEEKLRILFEPFNRLGAENTEIEGTGIGLTVTKKLVELMGGTISVTSKLGEGSCFTVYLSRGAPREIFPDTPTPTVAAGLAEDKPNRPNAVLYIEDNSANIALVQQILLRRPKVRLLCAPQAKLGIELARAHRPDVILMDINLPGMDGIAALRHLRGFEETRGIPVIAVSAKGMEKDVENGLSAGFYSYIVKPIDVTRFLAEIDALLSG